jgi:hypothetical protein
MPDKQFFSCSGHIRKPMPVPHKHHPAMVPGATPAAGGQRFIRYFSLDLC